MTIMNNCERRRRQLRQNYFMQVRRETQEAANEENVQKVQQKVKQIHEARNASAYSEESV